MAFILDQDPTFKWPVSFDVPVDGRHELKKFEGEFRRLGQSRVNAITGEIQARMVAMQAGEDASEMISDQSIADEVLVGWSGILDRDGDEVPFSEGVKRRLLDVEAVAAAIVTAWGDSLRGAKRKN